MVVRKITGAHTSKAINIPKPLGVDLGFTLFVDLLGYTIIYVLVYFLLSPGLSSRTKPLKLTFIDFGPHTSACGSVTI